MKMLQSRANPETMEQYLTFELENGNVATISVPNSLDVCKAYAMVEVYDRLDVVAVDGLAALSLVLERKIGITKVYALFLASSYTMAHKMATTSYEMKTTDILPLIRIDNQNVLDPIVPPEEVAVINEEYVCCSQCVQKDFCKMFDCILTN